MAFTPSTLSVIVQPIGGVGIRFLSYITDDSQDSVTGQDYFASTVRFGLRVGDLIFVIAGTPGSFDTYVVTVDTIDAGGNATVILSTEPLPPGLVSIGALITKADQTLYTTGEDTWAVTTLTPFVRTIMDDPNAAEVLTTLGVSGFVQTLLDDADAATARLTLSAQKQASSLDTLATVTPGTAGLAALQTMNFATPSDVAAGSPEVMVTPLSLTDVVADIITAQATADSALSLGTKGIKGYLLGGPVDVLDTTGLDPATDYENGDVIDTITIVTGMRIGRATLDGDGVATADPDNAVWIAPASGAASRATDANTEAELVLRAFSVRQGTYAGETWYIANDTIASLGTTPITVAPVGGPFPNSELLDDLAEVYTLNEDFELEIWDANDFIVARFSFADAMVGGLVTGVDKHAGTEWADANGFVFARLGEVQSLINGLRVENSAKIEDVTEFRDNNDFIFARLSPRESMINGLYVRTGGESIEVQDNNDFIIWRPEQASSSSGGGSTPVSNQPTSTVPYIGPVLYGRTGKDTSIILTNLLANRKDGALCEASIMPADEAYQVPPFKDAVNVRLDQMGGSARMVVYPTSWDGVTSSEITFDTKVCAASVTASTPIKILSITDSIGTYQGLVIQDEELRDMGYIPQWCGTTASEGRTPATLPHYGLDTSFRGENRPGIELADYTNLLTTSLDPVDIGSESAYLSGGTGAMRPLNPLIIPDDTVVADADLRNGYFIKFSTYFSRFSLTVADVLQLLVGTNDVKTLSAGGSYTRMYDETALMRRRWRADYATKPIIVGLCPPGRSSTTDELWRTNYTQAFRALWQLKKDVADPNFHIAAPHVSMLLSTGWDFSPSATLPDSATGVTQRTIADAIHPGPGPVRERLFIELARTTAYAFQNII